MASPNKIDRNASSLNRLRRNMQRIVMGAATSTLTLSSTGAIVDAPDGLSVNVDGSTVIINGNNQLGVRLRAPGSISNGGLLATPTGIEIALDPFQKGLQVQSTGNIEVLLADASLKFFNSINGGVGVNLGSTGSTLLSTATDGIDLVVQASTLVFAGPSTGAAAAPTFRKLASTDIPNLSSSALPSDIAYTDKANTFTLAQTITGTFTSMPGLVINSFQIQPFALNNSWFSENIYFDGSNFRYVASGAGVQVYFIGNEVQYRCFPAGVANAIVPTPFVCQMKINSDGSYAVGASINNGPGSISGATFVVTSTGNLGLNTVTEFGSGGGVIGLHNASTIPTTNPSGGGVLFTSSGALCYRGSAGTVTVIAPA